MTSKPSDAFANALGKFRDTLTDEQKNTFSLSSLSDVEGAINNIQANYGQRKQLRNMKRLGKFLEGMQQIEELVSVFLNVHEVVAFVWGPVKFALNIAKNRLESFEVLLDTYVEIGEAIPGLRQYEQIFKDYPSVREVLERCFYDILEFHKAALEVFTRTGWRKYFEYAWKTFKTRFKPILDSLKRHKALLLDEKLTATIAEVQAGRGEVQAFRLAIETRFNELSRQLETSLGEARDREARVLRESLIQKRRLVSSQLAAGNYEADQQSAFAQWSSSPSEDWVLQDERFKTWLQSKTNTSKMLYLHGMPGAGKTILISRIVNYLRSQKATLKGPVLFFYFKSREEDKRSMGCMLRALLDQLIYQDDGLVELLHPKCCSVSDSELRTLSTLKELLGDCVLTPRGCTIVLDGLDECQDEQHNTWKDPGLIIDWINNSLIPEFSNKGYSARFLIASQHVEFLEKELARHPSIRLDQDVGHLRNIQVYTQSRACDIERRFGLSKPDTAKLAEKVSESSNGFFLYARVVLDNLMLQGSNSELEEELETENFPADLEAAYERVAIRVLDRESRSKKASALKIFGWMICAPRPLSWTEIQSRFCIDPEQGHCNSENRRVDSCKALCSSLIDEEKNHEKSSEIPHTTVRFVHNTAGKYLIHTGRIRLIEQHVETALFCSRYLSSRPLQQELPFEAIEKFALLGYYGLLDYSATFWIPHLSSALDGLKDLPTETVSDLLSSAARAFQSYGTLGLNSGRSSQTKLQEVHAMLTNWCETGGKVHLEKRVSAIRGVIEPIYLEGLDENVRTIFLQLNGLPCFKCPKPDCHNFNIGFLESRDRDSHLNNHERPFKCLVPGCYFEIVGLRSQVELRAHSKFEHPDPDLPPLFPKPKSKSAPKKEVEIFQACAKGDLDSIQTYLDLGGDVNKRPPSKPELTPLVTAARHGQTLACGLLIDNGATQIFLGGEGDSYRMSWRLDESATALLAAMEQENYDLFWYLIHKASQWQMKEFTSSKTFGLYLTEAMNLRDDQIFRYLLSLCDSTGRHSDQRYLDPDSLLYVIISKRTSVSKLTIALEWLFSTTVKDYSHLPKLGTEVRYAPLTKGLDDKSDTMLHVACRYRNLPVVRFLLNRLRQEDINKVNDQQRTALFDAVITSDDDTEIMELLLVSDKGAAANIKDTCGCLPIHYACSDNKTEKLTLLTKHTKDLNAENAAGDTPLILAVGRGSAESVHILLDTERVDILRHNRFGKTAVDRVPRLKRPFDMLGLLKQHNSSILNSGSVTAYLESFLEECISTSRPAKLELILELHPTWLIGQLLEHDRVEIAKACLSGGAGFVPANEMLDVWELVEDEPDAELRALVLLQGQLPQEVWWEQLPDIKDMLEPYSSSKYLLDLLIADEEAQQTLLHQAEFQNDEELRNLLWQHGMS